MPQPDPVLSLGGCLLGAAVGDAIGLPYEGLSMARARRFARLPLRHRFLLGRGMVSDDTDHSIFVAQSLIVCGGDEQRFRRALAWRLRWWLLCLPAGIGMATLKGILRLWLGMRNSGVRSGGNGPSMRSAFIGAWFRDDTLARQRFVETSTRLTHNDPIALAGALAVAEIAARIASGRWRERPAVEELVLALDGVSTEPAWRACVQRIREACLAPDLMQAALQTFGSKAGVSGYTLHSVPFAVIAWYLHFDNYANTVESVTQAGGDVDTVAAIAGALAGTRCGPEGIPRDWLDRLVDWPHSVAYMRRLAQRCVDGGVAVPVHLSPWLLPRGALFMTVVLAHGFRRLLPPYGFVPDEPLPRPAGWNKTLGDLWAEKRSLGADEMRWAREFEREQLRAWARFPKEGELFETVSDTTVTFQIHWRAPFSTGGEAVLPRGTRVRPRLWPGDPEPIAVDAIPLEERKFEELLVPEADRRSRKYDGYSLSIPVAQLNREFVLLTPSPAEENP